MKRYRLVVFATPAIALLILSGGFWWAISQPPVERPPLAGDLIANSSAAGRKLLASSAARIDYGQITPVLQPQIRRAFCGPATAAAVINAALGPRAGVTQLSLFNAATTRIKSELAVSLGGLTLEELGGFFRAQGLLVRAVHAGESDIRAFRTAAQSVLSEPFTFLVINYDRQSLAQSGGGHISPVGALNTAADRLLVLDVAGHRYPYTWVSVPQLWRAMNTVDPDSGRTRGYLLVSTPPPVAPATDR